MIVRYRTVGCAELQSCPAEVDMQTGVVSINADVWDMYDDFEKSFLIAHEMGHYILGTDDEKKADEYALNAVYRIAPKSLKRSLQALYRIGIVDSSRMLNLYQAALNLDARDGNQAAAIELQNIENDYKREFYTDNNQNNKTMKKTNYIRTRRADGAEVVETVETEKKRGHSVNGITVAGCYFSFTNIMLIIIAVLMVIILKKQ